MTRVEGMMSFAADRRARMERADGQLSPYITAALESGDWDRAVLAASQLWLDVYGIYAPRSDYRAELSDFQDQLERALAKTTMPDGDPEPAQVDRVTRFIGTAAVNDATVEGVAASGGGQLQWLSMHDDDVRNTHTAADGQIRDVGERFDVGDARLRYPGDPSGAIDETINCRCVLAPVGRTIMAAAEPLIDAGVDDFDPDAEADTDEEGPYVDDLVDIPWHAVLAPEGIPTGDGRSFAVGALSMRNLPLPLTYQYETAPGHDKSVIVGRIDEAWRDEATNTYRGRGVFWAAEPMTQKVIDGVAGGFLRGVSIDVDNMIIDYDASADDPSALNGGTTVFSEARISALAIVPIPAYQEAYIALGEAFDDELTEADHEALAACGCAGVLEDIDEDEFRNVPTAERKKLADEGEAMPDGSYPIANEQDLKNAIQAIGRAKNPEAVKAHIKKRARALGHPELIPEGWAAEVVTAAAGTKDGPGWITNPRATARIRRYWTHGKGAAEIRWGAPGDFNRCRRQLAKYVENPDWLAGTCANMHKEALGLWPGTERGGRHSNLTASVPAVTLTAAANRVTATAFTDPHLDGPTPITIDGDRIYGHLATWGVCHIGIPGVCTTPPHSAQGYAYFTTGAVATDEGLIPVGQITMDTGHAPMTAGSRAAAAHYDHTGSVVADVAAGEDAHGIWVAGVLRPGVSELKRAELAAAALSGDWREIAGNLELVAALAVNVPGFPIPRTQLAASGGRQDALVASGIVERSPDGQFTADEIAAIVRTAVADYRHQERIAERAAAIAPARERVRALRVHQLRDRIEEAVK